MLLGNVIIFNTMITFFVVPKKGEPTIKGARGFLLVYGLSRYKCPSQGLAWFCLFTESISNKQSRKRDARRMENPKKSCPNGLAQLCGLAQLYGLSKRSQPFFFWKKIRKKHMNPWYGYIPLRWAHRLFSWYLQCSASSALLRGMYPSPGRPNQ